MQRSRAGSSAGRVPCVLLAALVAAISVRGASYVSFAFRPPDAAANPFAREIWAEVALPDGETIRLPAFYAGEGIYAVRAFAPAAGTYRVASCAETSGEQSGPLEVEFVSPPTVRRDRADAPSFVRRDPKNPQRFLTADGAPYVPLGSNLAWANRDGIEFYRRALTAFGRSGLNWARIWMCHWARQNLDWLPEKGGRSPAPGALDLSVAAFWDELLELAESDRVYLQVVLQHHGQFSTAVNPNWNDHPWNAANPGGFLQTPGEFFTSPEARRLTKQKYRYIVARWGCSPAVLAWELFNEVHWVDAIRIEQNEAAVAAWHAEMAEYLRSIDTYRHLVTTSTDDLQSPIYAQMDFLQPHLYAPNMLANVRRFRGAPGEIARPVFYGEVGTQAKNQFSPGEQRSGRGLVPPVWASVLGAGALPAQSWFWDRLLEDGHVEELAAVGRFLKASGLDQREGASFSPAVESDQRVPRVLPGGQFWHKQPAPDIVVPLDGSEPFELGDMPVVLVGSAESLAEGYPGRATLHFDFPDATNAVLRFADAGPRGATARVSVDGVAVAEQQWASLIPPDAPDAPAVAPDPAQAPERPAPRPAEASFAIPAGAHVIVIENVGGPDWFALREFDPGVGVAALAAIGKRGPDFLALWVWHRDGLLARESPAAATATLVLDEVPAGNWRVTWWDSLKGTPGEPTIIRHAGGTLRLPTPPIRRQAAVLLERAAAD